MTVPSTMGGRSPRVWFAAVTALALAIGVIAFLTENGSGGGGTPAQQMSTWESATNLAQDLGALRGDGIDLQKVRSARAGTSAIHTVCDVLRVTAETAYGSLPSPNAEVTQLLAHAYMLEYEAGVDCYQAGANGKTLLRKSATERAKAEQIIRQALTRIALITGKVLATTTTTEPTSDTSIFG